MGIFPQMTRTHARSLAGKGYLLREMKEGTTNKFHIECLFEALKKMRKHAQIKAGEQPGEPMILRRDSNCGDSIGALGGEGVGFA
jgi:hypothetical protein